MAHLPTTQSPDEPDITSKEYAIYLLEQSPELYVEWLRIYRPECYRDWQRMHQIEEYREWLRVNRPDAYREWQRTTHPDRCADFTGSEHARFRDEISALRMKKFCAADAAQRSDIQRQIDILLTSTKRELSQYQRDINRIASKVDSDIKHCVGAMLVFAHDPLMSFQLVLTIQLCKQVGGNTLSEFQARFFQWLPVLRTRRPRRPQSFIDASI
jgi:hypothetical protein